MFSTSVSPSKCVTEPAFEVGRLVASPIAKTFGAALDCRVCGSVGTKPSSSPRPGERPTYAAPPWSGTDEQVERDLALVVADQPAAGAVDLAGVELGDQLDALLVEQPAELLDATGLVNAPSSGVT